jgi:hypothetical protein
MPNNLPTEPGYYWYRVTDVGSGEAYEWEVAQVLSEHAGPGVIIEGITYQMQELEGEWGPRIHDPDELQEKVEADAALDEAIKRSIKHAHDMIRDDLARKLLVGILMGGDFNVPVDVKLAYEYADAMLNHRATGES